MASSSRASSSRSSSSRAGSSRAGAAAKGASKQATATTEDATDAEPAEPTAESVGDEPEGSGAQEAAASSGCSSDSPWPGADLLDVGAFIRTQRELAEMSVRRLAELANVSNPYLSQIERGLRNPSAEILQQVANALRISVESLYVRAGLLKQDEHPAVSVTEAIEADPHLTEDQKETLRRVYTSFTAARSDA